MPTLNIPIGTSPPPLYDLCTTFPSTPDGEIVRDQHLDTFDRVLQNSIDILVIEGDSGIGKTTLLSQFAKQHPRTAVSSFVSTKARHKYDPVALRIDYSAQIISILDPTRIVTPSEERDGVLQSLLQRLKRRHARNRIYFILDGLTDITDPIMLKDVFHLLPIGLGFPVIVSGDLSSIPSELKDGRRIKTTQASNFSFSEVQQYFSDMQLKETDIRKIYKDFGKGIPERLASVRRSLKAGLDFTSLRGERLDSLYEDEWKHAAGDGFTRHLLALVAHASHPLTVSAIAEMLGVDIDLVWTRLRDLQFIEIDTMSDYVAFASQSFLIFATNKLIDMKRSVVTLLAEHVENIEAVDPHTAAAVPAYLQDLGQLDRVISYLSPEHFSDVLERSESFEPLHRQLQVGIDVASQLRRDGELIRFGLQRSAFREIETAQVSRSEIEALVATDQISEALSLAANCPLREDRLHLLGVVGRCAKERELQLDEDINEQIRRLWNQVDPESLGDKAIDIAADVFPCCPDVAIGLIEGGVSDSGDENELDVAYVRLSLASALRNVGDIGDDDSLDLIRKQIRNPRLRRITSSVSGNEQSAAQVIEESKTLDTASDKLYVLRKWALENPTRGDAMRVVQHGLQTLVATTGYAPNPRVLRELSSPLIYIEDRDILRRLVRSFDGQCSSLEERGPTEEITRLQLNLAIGESFFDVEACTDRLVGVYLDVDALDDLATKSSCLVRLFGALKQIGCSDKIEKKEHLGAMSVEGIETSVRELLSHTALQVEVARAVIEAWASVDPGRSVSLATKLNTATRREEGLLLAVEAILENEPDLVDFHLLRSACDSLRQQASRDHVAAATAEYLVRHASTSKPGFVDTGYKLFQECFFAVSDPMERCRVLCLLYGLAEKKLYHNTDTVRDDLSARIRTSLDAVEPGWRRIDTGFRVARSIVAWRPDEALDYLQAAKAEREKTALSSASSEWTYQASIRLSIRAFAGQLDNGYDLAYDTERLTRLIDRLPTTSLQADLWAEFAMHLFLQQHSDDGNRVVIEKVIPLIDSMQDEQDKASTIVSVAPALYQNHRSTALRFFDALERTQRNTALMTCAKFILQRHIPSDPYEPHENGYPIRHQSAIDVLDLAREIDQDNMIYTLITALADTLAPTGHAKLFSRPQVADVVRLIEEIIDLKFPDLENIVHDGYAIASEAQLLRIQSKKKGQHWTKLRARARSIPNKSDQALVLAIIGQALPPHQELDRKPIFEEALRVTASIPCNYDRIARLNDLAEKMTRKCPDMARECLHTAVSKHTLGQHRDVHVFRDLIDTAFKIEPDFASALVSLMNDDPARGLVQHEMKRRLDTLHAKKSIIDTPKSWESVGESSRDLPRSAWLALGSLNATRISAQPMDQLRPALRSASRMPLSESYPILAWVIANAVRRFSGSAESRSIVRVMFEGLINGAELAEIASTSASVTARRVTPALSAPRGEESLVVRQGERDRAAEFLKAWLQRNASEYVYICDQYFGPEELGLLMLVQTVVPDMEMAVLTSSRRNRKHCKDSLESAYLTEWRKISDQATPTADIVVVGLGDAGKSPIHDRCILTEGGGISLGTSWNSLGITQDSVVRVMSDSEAFSLCEVIEEFLFRKKKTYGGERLHYKAFSLSG